jgi:succinate dehydrogenase / fumarate reductase cytochrome b subunit
MATVTKKMARTRPIHRLVAFLDSTVGQKAIAALTGLGLVGFVVVHMLGNLQMFLGAEAINNYADKLKSLGMLLWGARIGLLALVGLHIAVAVRLTLRNRAARAGRYAVARHQVSTTSSRYMIFSGSLILVFVIFHLLHFTVGVIQPESYQLTDAQGRHDVYRMVVHGFQNWGIASFYIVSMAVLGSHLSHATFSLFQSLGAPVGGKDTRLKKLARYVAVGVILGFVSIPLAVIFGWLGTT